MEATTLRRSKQHVETTYVKRRGDVDGDNGYRVTADAGVTPGHRGE